MMAALEALLLDEAPIDLHFRLLKEAYGLLEEQDKARLFEAIIARIDTPLDHTRPLLEALLDCQPDDHTRPALLADLRARIHSPRLKVFRKIARAPGGLKFLLDFRGDVLSVRRHSPEDLSPLDADIVFLLEMWFEEGFLYLEEITLDSAYKQIELIKDRDMVHPMTSIEEVGQRLGHDRRCFALYHRLLPYEPIIFIEVALTCGLVGSITEIMASTGNAAAEGRKDTAVFYSINNTQNGLSGLGMGKLLIGRVVNYLREEDDRIGTFATLSPVTGYRPRYLEPLLQGNDDNFILKHDEVITFFSKKAAAAITSRTGGDPSRAEDFNKALLTVLGDDAWSRDEALKKHLRAPLVKLTYHYVAHEKDSRGKPLNPVAGFHLGNGASISMKHVNFLANPSPRGLRMSCGFMVNYVYSSSWLSQLRRTFRVFDKVEIKGLFSRDRRP